MKIDKGMHFSIRGYLLDEKRFKFVEINSLSQMIKSYKSLPFSILRDDKRSKWENLEDLEGGIPPNAWKVLMSVKII